MEKINYEEMYFELLKENQCLRFKVAISKVDEWYINDIVQNEMVREYHNIILADNYTLKGFIPLLNEFGYERLNNYFMRLVDEAIKKEEAEKEEVDENGE